MNVILPDHWYIPPPAAAAAARDQPGDDGRLARIAELSAERMAESLAFLSGYAPGVLDAVLTATEPCLDDLLPPDADALEPYCARCGAKAGVFTAHGLDWRHYAGDAEDRTARPFDADHAPVIGWRPASGHPVIAAL
ncbi:MAG TPA: hypothetical protein VGD91_09785 [Trebonia sp.]